MAGCDLVWLGPRRPSRATRCAGLLAASVVLSGGHASASNPLEFPDNGSAAFSRGGAWLATASDPIAAHYNPATLATQGSGMSLELLFAYNDVCFDRRNPDDALTGPRQGENPDVRGDLQYDPVCNVRTAAPRVVPSLALTWRVTDRLGVGIAIVPPASYGVAAGEWPAVARGYNARPGVEREQDVPAPYRYLTLGSRATVLFPTLSAGYEPSPGFRIGAGFVWGVAVIDVLGASPAQVAANDVGDNVDHPPGDSRSNLRTKDLFVPGVVLGVHWSATRHLDVAAWGRFIDAVEAHDAEVEVIGNYYADDLRGVRPICQNENASSPECQGRAIRNVFSGDDFVKFRTVIPPEIRAGVRFHLPRAPADTRSPWEDEPSTRDPLRDDVFDVELDASYTMNSAASLVEVRFRQGADGSAVVPVDPLGVLPPSVDRPTGWKDSIGLRLGGEYALIAGVLGLRAGAWIETAAADPEWLQVSPVPALRGGVGGGVVIRRGRIDLHVGYQRHVSAGMDNHGDGAIRATAGVLRDCAGPGCPAPGTAPEPPFRLGAPAKGQQFRSFQAVNGGSVTQSAHVFTAGAVVRL